MSITLTGHEQEISSSECLRKGCTRPAAWEPVVTLPPPVWWPGHPTESKVGLPVCDHHKRDTTLAHVLPPETRDHLRRLFLSRGRVPPDFSRATVRFERIKRP